LICAHQSTIEDIIKKYLWAARNSKKEFPWYTGFVFKFWFNNKQHESMFDEHSLVTKYDFRPFWKIIEHGLTAKDFADITTVDNEHVREIIAMMYGKNTVYPFSE